MSDSPILVAGRALPQAGTINSPIVMPAKVAQSNIVNAAAGVQSSVYKVKMIANGKTFNMLLPPSIESKHPGRSNPIQLPGLLIKAGIAISKLKIPGFFPIYQHLGVESLTVSMSGMFTGYDGISNLSEAAQWEGWQDLTIKEGQDSYTSACEFYDFAVKNKALIEVNIATSDGSFIPKKSESTTFRDSSSNIRFKGYVKEFEQVYIRQDRNYYMIKFEIIDLGTNICKSAKSTTPTTIPAKDNPCKGDALVLQYNKLSKAEKQVYNDLLLKRGFTVFADPTEVQIGGALLRANDYYKPTDLNNLLDRLKADPRVADDYVDPISSSFTPSTNFSNSVSSIVNPPINTPNQSNPLLLNNINQLNDTYNYRQQRGLISDLKNNNGVISDATMSNYADINKNLSKSYKYVGNSKTDLSLYPAATFQTDSGDTLLLIPIANDFSKFRLTPP